MTTVRALYFEGCPNHEPTLSLVRQVVADLAFDAQVEPVRVKDAEDAKRLRFLCSPSVQVNGVDVEPEARTRQDFAFGCRVYSGLGVPPRQIIEAALKEAKRLVTRSIIAAAPNQPPHLWLVTSQAVAGSGRRERRLHSRWFRPRVAGSRPFL